MKIEFLLSVSHSLHGKRILYSYVKFFYLKLSQPDNVFPLLILAYGKSIKCSVTAELSSLLVSNAFFSVRLFSNLYTRMRKFSINRFENWQLLSS